ncbi:MAG: G5 domain-containing protein, partial [Abditibacteriota bacterium]|nr:G5 domain-containing protein [Abditibacteriota bacterium]
MLKRRPRISKLLTAVLLSALLLGVIAMRDSIVEAETPTKKNITIIYNGEKLNASTTMETVGGALMEAGITVDSNDRVSAKMDFPVKKGMIIYVNRVEVEEITETVIVPFETLRTFSRDQKHGTIKTLQEGQNGEKKVTYKITRVGSKEISRVADTTEVIKETVPCIISIGSKGEYTSRGGNYRTKKVLTMKATAYDAQTFKGRKTSTGRKAVYSMAAVDPKFIPLGTKLYIEGYGYAIAGDTGGA